MATKLVGLDIGTTMVRAAEVAVTHRIPGQGISGTVLRYGSAPIPAGAVSDGEVHEANTLASVLKQLWSANNFSTKDVAIGIGNARTVVREMDMAELPMNQLRSALPFQVEEFLPMSTDESLLDFFPTSQVATENGTALRGIVVAQAKHSVSSNVLAVENAGLKPKIVDLKAFALVRSLVHGNWNSSTVALVDIGARTTSVVIVEAGRPRLARMLPAGGHDITEAVASALQLPHSEADVFKRDIGLGQVRSPEQQPAADAILASVRSLIDGIRNTFVYFMGNNQGVAIQHVILTGGGAHLPGLGQALASATRQSVSFGDGTGMLKVSKSAAAKIRGQESLVAVTLGLATAEVME